VQEYFPNIPKIRYEGPDSNNPLAFKHYNPKQRIMGKTMAQHLRFSVCFWHTFKGAGADPFGPGTFLRSYANEDPMLEAEQTLRAAFEFFTKLGVDFWCFHDLDICPEADNLQETNRRYKKLVKLAKSLQKDNGIQLLWGTSNLFANRRFMSGAATSPSPAVFAYAASQVKRALDATKTLGGGGYTFWGGREGYETILNTDMGREMDHLGRFLQMAVDYKKKIRFKGQFYIEPKPKEPTKHQYDFDAASCHAFLQKYGLMDDFKLNLEANHATLAGHTFHHELAYAAANGILGSIDANRGDLLLGWDTDQFPTNIYDTTMTLWILLKAGGFKTGGFNFDAKVRRQSTAPEDLFYAHIGGMDALARGLKAAAKIIKEKRFEKFVSKRYSGWNRGLGKKIESGQTNFEELEAYTLKHGEPSVQSGNQELLENWLNEAL